MADPRAQRRAAEVVEVLADHDTGSPYFEMEDEDQFEKDNNKLVTQFVIVF